MKDLSYAIFIAIDRGAVKKPIPKADGTGNG
jgi:hypothetical protein